MAPYGSLWLLMAPYVSLWRPYGSLLFLMATRFVIWHHRVFAAYVSLCFLCLILASYVSLCLLVAPYGSLWLLMSPYGALMACDGFLWLLIALIIIITITYVVGESVLCRVGIAAQVTCRRGS